ncbi:MAG: multicopper oxidase family protein [Terriglobales bacterium]
MPCTRREFLWRTTAGFAGLALAPAAWAQARAATLDPARLPQWAEALPLPRLARPSAPGQYEITMQEAWVSLHPALPPTRCWTYNGTFPGPLLEVRSGDTVRIHWSNRLPRRHFLPVDPSLEGSQPALPPVRAVVHVHGARVPAASDGYPEDWIVPGHEQVFTYPNRQEAAPLFYHDHAIGLSRLNVYAGLAGPYWVRDELEESLRLPAGPLEIPLLLCDRWLDPEGQLYYPVSGIPGHPWVPEVYGNCMLVNGALWPRLQLEPTVYRLRLANIANSRFFRLSFSDGLPLHVIGSDQGLLAAPAALRHLLLAPAERADVLVDFRRAAGRSLDLLNDGLPILRARVAAAPGDTQDAWQPPAVLRALPAALGASAVRRRPLTLDEYDGYHGLPALMLLNGTGWTAPVSEKPHLGDTEVWMFINSSGDTHPIHLHQVRFRILERHAFDIDQFLQDGTLLYIAAPEAPAPAESGWKDTVRCPAGTVTRIVVRFESYSGRYVWHCHILEHEANMMMRPYEILAPAAHPEP